jgi:hypothetical protein
MTRRPRLAGSTAHPDPRQHRLDTEAHMLECRRQEQVVLEAIPAPPAGHELPLKIGLLQRDGDAAVGVEVLERDRRRVRPVDRLPGRLIRRVQADPAEVRVEIEHRANVPTLGRRRASAVGWCECWTTGPFGLMVLETLLIPRAQDRAGRPGSVQFCIRGTGFRG